MLLREGRVAGARFADGETVRCSAVLLAGGGFAGLWRFSSWNKLLRGDALLFARSAGAALDGLGLVQYEPTVTVYPEALCGFPVITTVLNAGARLLDREGNSLLAPGEPVPCKRELARRIAEALAAGRGWEHGGIRYDFSGVDEAEFARKYPGYYRKFRRFARSFRELFFEVKPGAHTTLGGIRIEPDGSTAVPGLFAAGECIGNLHGCDRLGGNAGLEVLVFCRSVGGEVCRRTVNRISRGRGHGGNDGCDRHTAGTLPGNRGDPRPLLWRAPVGEGVAGGVAGIGEAPGLSSWRAGAADAGGCSYTSASAIRSRS